METPANLLTKPDITSMFRLDGKNALVTGGAGVLGAGLARVLGQAGARVAVADIAAERAEECARSLRADGIEAIPVEMNALERESIREGVEVVDRQLGPIQILLNAAGGNMPAATVNEEHDFFHLDEAALKRVVELNLFAGAIIPSQIVGERMAKRGECATIINISSMCAFRPLTRVVGYAAAKAAVSNFTQWLAVYLAQEGCPKVRVNAIAPGFFLTEQNRFLLTQEDGSLTARGQSIITHTPMGRFGLPDDLCGTLLWLASDASAFVTGVVVPIDGGFSAFSGV